MARAQPHALPPAPPRIRSLTSRPGGGIRITLGRGSSSPSFTVESAGGARQRFRTAVPREHRKSLPGTIPAPPLLLLLLVITGAGAGVCLFMCVWLVFCFSVCRPLVLVCVFLCGLVRTLDSLKRKSEEPPVEKQAMSTQVACGSQKRGFRDHRRPALQQPPR